MLLLIISLIIINFKSIENFNDGSLWKYYFKKHYLDQIHYILPNKTGTIDFEIISEETKDIDMESEEEEEDVYERNYGLHSKYNLNYLDHNLSLYKKDNNIILDNNKYTLKKYVKINQNITMFIKYFQILFKFINKDSQYKPPINYQSLLANNNDTNNILKKDRFKTVQNYILNLFNNELNSFMQKYDGYIIHKNKKKILKCDSFTSQFKIYRGELISYTNYFKLNIESYKFLVFLYNNKETDDILVIYNDVIYDYKNNKFYLVNMRLDGITNKSLIIQSGLDDIDDIFMGKKIDTNYKIRGYLEKNNISINNNLSLTSDGKKLLKDLINNNNINNKYSILNKYKSKLDEIINNYGDINNLTNNDYNQIFEILLHHIKKEEKLESLNYLEIINKYNFEILNNNNLYKNNLNRYNSNFRCINFPKINTKFDCQQKNGIWDKPCANDLECPYFKQNKNYPNNFGKCLISGYCEMPLTLEPIIKPKAFTKISNNIPLCHNCNIINCQGIECNNCCENQKNKNLYKNLDSPDYIFDKDILERQKSEEILKKRDILVNGIKY